MEARICWARAMLAVAASLVPTASFASSYRTPNFVIEAPTPELAEKIGKTAEYYRRELAIQWLGSAMPNWSRPCPIQAEVAPNLGAGGATSFVFDRGEVFNWDMKIQGSEERLLDSVLPHEVTHTIFASYFRRPLPRWADEGACTTVEHASERNKQQTMLINFLRTGHGIAFDQMFAMKEYPPDVLPLYSQGYSLARYLIDQGGRQKFLEFVGDGMKTDNWSAALDKHYSIANLKVLQNDWLDWVKQGSPDLSQQKSTIALASVQRKSRSDNNPVFRAQSDDRLSSTTSHGAAGGNELASLSKTDSRRTTARQAGQTMVGPRAILPQPNLRRVGIHRGLRQARRLTPHLVTRACTIDNRIQVDRLPQRQPHHRQRRLMLLVGSRSLSPKETRVFRSIQITACCSNGQNVNEELIAITDW